MKLDGRLNGVFDDDGGVTDPDDEAFAKRVGQNMSKVTEARLVFEGLRLLLETINEAPSNTTGVEWFDA